MVTRCPDKAAGPNGAWGLVPGAPVLAHLKEEAPVSALGGLGDEVRVDRVLKGRTRFVLRGEVEGVPSSEADEWMVSAGGGPWVVVTGRVLSALFEVDGSSDA